MDINLLTKLINLREHYCSIERKLYDDNHTIQLVQRTMTYEFVTHIESILSAELKERAKKYYQERIAEVTKEIEDLYNEENESCSVMTQLN
jgi:ABC-type Zn uptake system ZnuABC Zn-binding protein ZnuA